MQWPAPVEKKRSEKLDKLAASKQPTWVARVLHLAKRTAAGGRYLKGKRKKKKKKESESESVAVADIRVGQADDVVPDDLVHQLELRAQGLLLRRRHVTGQVRQP